MDSRRLRALTPRQRALAAMAVLLDGREASIYLENDAVNGEALKEAAEDLSRLDPDLRMPLAGSLLRDALGAIDE